MTGMRISARTLAYPQAAVLLLDDITLGFVAFLANHFPKHSFHSDPPGGGRFSRPALHETLILCFSTLDSQQVKEARFQVLYRWNEYSSPRNLAQIHLTGLKLLHIILALSQDRTIRGDDSTSTPELQSLLNANPVDIGEVDSVLHRSAQTEPLKEPPPQPGARGNTYDQLCALQSLQASQLGKVEIVTDVQTDGSYICLEHWCFMSRTIIPTLLENRMRWKMDLPVPPNQPFRADKHCCVVDYSLDLALLGHAEDNVNTILFGHSLDLPCAGTWNRLCQMGDLVPHRIPCQV